MDAGEATANGDLLKHRKRQHESIIDISFFFPPKCCWRPPPSPPGASERAREREREGERWGEMEKVEVCGESSEGTGNEDDAGMRPEGTKQNHPLFRLSFTQSPSSFGALGKSHAACLSILKGLPGTQGLGLKGGIAQPLWMRPNEEARRSGHAESGTLGGASLNCVCGICGSCPCRHRVLRPASFLLRPSQRHQSGNHRHHHGEQRFGFWAKRMLDISFHCCSTPHVHGPKVADPDGDNIASAQVVVR
eukprot:scaffold8060_cov391-Pinguiococcus_pyrenoidosus.AAC.2